MPFDPDRKEYLTVDENGLKDILAASLKDDFILKREVWGRHLLGGIVGTSICKLV